MSNPKVVNLKDILDGTWESASGTCKTHGDYTTSVLVINGNPQPAECPDCMQETIRIEREKETARCDAELLEKQQLSRLNGIGLPGRMTGKRWSDYKPPNTNAQELLDICKTFADNFQDNYATGSNLIMTGNTGNGKTHLACVLCKQVAVQNNIRPKYTTVAAMLRYIRGSFNSTEYTESDALEKYSHAGLLVIDELGVKLSSEYDKSTLFEIIDERYQAELPTVVISNLSIAEIEETIDARLVDRLSENGTLMVFDWGSYRGVSDDT